MLKNVKKCFDLLFLGSRKNSKLFFSKNITIYSKTMDSTDEQSSKCIKSSICAYAYLGINLSVYVTVFYLAFLLLVVLYTALQETNGVNDSGAGAITVLVGIALLPIAIAISYCLVAIIVLSCIECVDFCCSDSKNETNMTPSILTAPADRSDSNIV